jgi:hypothetical protein
LGGAALRAARLIFLRSILSVMVVVFAMMCFLFFQKILQRAAKAYLSG